VVSGIQAILHRTGYSPPYGGAIYAAQEFDMPQGEIILLGIWLNVTAAAGSLVLAAVRGQNARSPRSSSRTGAECP
jgi:MFS-type transporter involved in bile tolerance (Atg22 family)